MSKKLRTEAVDHLFDAILSLENREECYTFFEDVCTVNELLSLSQRFEVAKMLRDQKTYLDIAEKTGASTATISRVNRSLNYGNDGYDMVFARMAASETNEAYNRIEKPGKKEKPGAARIMSGIDSVPFSTGFYFSFLEGSFSSCSI